MIEMLLRLTARVDELERRVGRIARIAKVDSVDKDAGMLQARLASGLVIGPMRWAALSGAVWAPPETGEQVIVLCPGGEDGLMVALAGIGSSGGKGDKHVIGAGTTRPVAVADPVKAEFQKVIAALASVSAGGNAFTGPNTYTTVGNIAAAKTEVE